MRIKVAGAGSGKTTKMTAHILGIDIPVGKVVYCVAFTNAAADNIRSKLIEQTGMVPDNVKVSTIHSFLYSEFVQPYYHLLYGSRYKKISTINLPDQPACRRMRISELEDMQLLHVTAIPERAKWVVHKKTKDTARIRAMRDKVLAMFGGYCHKIIVDEAQDIDKDVRDVLLALDKVGIDIELCGDPKQDVQGRKCFRELIDKYQDDVTYSSECHRSPQLHLDISNRLADEKEKQVADEDICAGSMDVLFEKDEDVATLVVDGGFGLMYISKKNERFDTHASKDSNGGFVTLRHELEIAIKVKHGNDVTELEIKRASYYIAGQMISFVAGGGDVSRAIRSGISNGCYDYDKTRYARLAKALETGGEPASSAIVVRSIEAIKGLEHDRCLFILTMDLAPYLVGDKTDDNKTKHLLYVALTRSLDNLTVLVTKEVESRYSRKRIMDALGIDAS